MQSKQRASGQAVIEPMYMPYTKEDIVNLLKEGICEVTFRKVNGEMRVMPCTLQADLLPITNQKELTFETVRRTNDDNLSVWCTDKQAWRSFKISNVTLISPMYDREKVDSNP